MNINFKGYVLNQRQLNAITPVMNDLIQGRVSQEKYEQACVEALEKAGCPLGYDTDLQPDAPLDVRARRWIVDGRVGMSSKAIWSHMTDTPSEEGYSHPHDTNDLNRCLLLLDLIPEWRPRMGEMAEHSPQWAALASQWELITETFLGEVGLDWVNGKSAPNTYALMKSALSE